MPIVTAAFKNGKNHTCSKNCQAKYQAISSKISSEYQAKARGKFSAV